MAYGRRVIVVVGYEKRNDKGALDALNELKEDDEHIPEVRMQT